MSDPILFGTERDYAWDAYQKAFDAGKLLPDRTKCDAWWEIALKVAWKDLHEMMSGAWGSGVQDRNEQGTAGFNAWWQEILDKQPVTKP